MIEIEYTVKIVAVILAKFNTIMYDSLFFMASKMAKSVLFQKHFWRKRLNHTRYSNFHVCLIPRKCFMGLYLTVDF